MKWRHGRKVPNHIYEQKGDEPNDKVDPPIGSMYTPEAGRLAALAPEMLAMLGELEWCADPDLGMYCPLCREDSEHADECEFGALLRRARGAE